ncbi:ribosomal protein L11 methyltransferase [Helicobacter sp. 13S00401-1]|uniref:50S ribosomal protein L11 methyltransferase n=1 Tax=Helicobacter sp. 13S00401-1 TaxID=1905758 RepID=UPI000BA655E8|nr:50S ribosomal protein L11 methyltransferase [Helicobacter sp. 13S00401-1]PAF51066.1 ribosomal protein L11 methyltransferase [Helicobacter sp. 13S00401-1]
MLVYEIKGKLKASTLKGNPKELKKHTIIWRTSKSLKEIESILKDYEKEAQTDFQKKDSFEYAIYESKNIDWIKEYEDSIEPISVGGFYIRPSFKKPLADKNLTEIVLDPSLSFGSGHHATTFMCIEELAKLDLKDKTLMDVGCGSGILSLIATKLGAKVEACDTDGEALNQTRLNFHKNGENLHNLFQGSITKGEKLSFRVYDVVVANIVTDVILLLKNAFSEITKKDSILILSGILDGRQKDVVESFSDFRLESQVCKDEWACLKLVKR